MTRYLAAVLAGAALATAMPAAAQQGECDRQCLVGMTDAYAAALVADDPGAVPLADDIVTLENLESVAVGAGMWDTITGGPSDYVIHVADPVSQQVGMLAMMREGETPVMVGIRLKRENGTIVEAEHMVARDLSAGQPPARSARRISRLARAAAVARPLLLRCAGQQQCAPFEHGR